MKKLIALLLAAVICLSLVACGGSDEPNTPDVTTTASPDNTQPDGTGTTAPPDDGTGSGTEGTTAETTGTTDDEPKPDPNEAVVEYTYSDKLIEKLTGAIKSSPEAFLAYSAGNAPYMIQDAEFISGGKILTVSFPLVETKEADKNGNFYLTLYVFGTSLTELKSEPVRKIELKISGEEYGLTENSKKLQWLTLNVGDYDITLGKDESLAFFSADDTLIPAYSNTASIKNLVDTFGSSRTGFLGKLGTSSLSVSRGALLWDIGIERPYTYGSDEYAAILAEEAAFNAMVEALAEKYKGKKLSIMGDSISTFDGISNNTSHNSTIGDNAIYYKKDGSLLSSSDHTYWSRVIDALDMKLCVNNGYSASRVYGKDATGHTDSSTVRANQLHRDNGTPNDPSDDTLPDVILFYMGINDINNNVTFGNLMDSLEDLTHEQQMDKIDNWFVSLLDKTENGTKIIAGNTYTSFQEAYALTLYLMQETYKDAEIYLLNLMPCVKYYNNNGNRLNKMNSYNEFYNLMAEYFGLTVVDQFNDNEMEFDTNIQFYTDATDWLHPNAKGMEKMAECILRAIANKNGISES